MQTELAQESIILRSRGFLPIANHHAEREDESLTLWTNFSTGRRAISTNGSPLFQGEDGFDEALNDYFAEALGLDADEE